MPSITTGRPVTIKSFMISFLLPLRLDIRTRAGLLGPFASTIADLRTWWAGRGLLRAVEKATKTPPAAGVRTLSR
jgi:hypothetical protein